MKTLLVRTLDQWREWLTEHHASASEVWLIFHKRHTGVASLDYKDAPMVRRESATLRRTQGQRAIETARDRTVPYRPRL